MSSKESRRRKALILTIEIQDYNANMFYIFYVENSRRYIIVISNSRCSEYVYTGRSKCDSKPEFLDSWEALAR
jgi:hypothetical protein